MLGALSYFLFCCKCDVFAQLEMRLSGEVNALRCVCPTGVWASGLGGHGHGRIGPVLRRASAQIPSAETHLLQGRLAFLEELTNYTDSTLTESLKASILILISVSPSSLTPSASFLSVCGGSEHLPPSQGGQEIRADVGLVTRRPRRSSNRAGEKDTHTKISSLFIYSFICLVFTF